MSKRSDALYVRDIKDFRNLLIHEYFGVDLEILWNIIRSDLPSLYETIEMIDTEFDDISLK